MIVTTTYLELTRPEDLRPARPPADPVRIEPVEVVTPEFSRFLYTAVGGDWYWTDRLGWSYDGWQRWLDRPGVETWVGWVRGVPAGYLELAPSAPGEVEIAYFGLLPRFVGRGLGGHLLGEGTARAWHLAERWPDLPATRRVWLHTCTLDGPWALANYRARGFTPYRTEQADQTLPDRPPGPWPGARP